MRLELPLGFAKLLEQQGRPVEYLQHAGVVLVDRDGLDEIEQLALTLSRSNDPRRARSRRQATQAVEACRTLRRFALGMRCGNCAHWRRTGPSSLQQGGCALAGWKHIKPYGCWARMTRRTDGCDQFSAA